MYISQVLHQVAQSFSNPLIFPSNSDIILRFFIEKFRAKPPSFLPFPDTLAIHGTWAVVDVLDWKTGRQDFDIRFLTMGTCFFARTIWNPISIKNNDNIKPSSRHRTYLVGFVRPLALVLS